MRCRKEWISVSPRVSPKQNSRVSSSKKMIRLRSSDGEEFEIEENVAEDFVIPLPNVNSKILSKVIEYSKKHAESDEKTTDEELKAWDADFVKVDQVTLFDLISAASYLNINSLLNLTCQAVADMIKGKSPEEIRKTINNDNDLTPEEKEEMRREYRWAFE